MSLVPYLCVPVDAHHQLYLLTWPCTALAFRRHA